MCIKKESLEEHLLNAVEEAILLLFVDNHSGTTASTPSHISLPPPPTTHGFQGKELRLGFANASFCELYAQGKTLDEEVEGSLLLESLFVSDLERQRFVNRIGQCLEQQGNCSASNQDWQECFTTTSRHNDLKVEEKRQWPNEDDDDDDDVDSFVLVDRTRREQQVPVDFYLWKNSLVCCIFRRPFKLKSTQEKPIHHQSVTERPPKRPSAKIDCQEDVVDQQSTTQPTMLVNGRYHFPRSRMEWLDLIDKCAAPVFRGSVLEWLAGERDAICHWVSHKVPSFFGHNTGWLWKGLVVVFVAER